MKNGNLSQLRQAKQEDLDSDDGDNEYGNKPRFNLFNSIRKLNKLSFDNKDEHSHVLDV